MQLEGLLPIGTVVRLKNSKKRLIIIGVCQKSIDDDLDKHVFDYVGCHFPEGYLGATATYLFDRDKIESLYAIGYQDAEQLAFKVTADSIIEELRKSEDKAP